MYIFSWVIEEGQRQAELYTYFQIPQFLLDSWLLNWNSAGRRHVEIICTQPRRLSTIGVAERVAEERVEKIGNTVGYQVTFGASEDLTVKFQSTRIQSCCKTVMTSVLSLDYCNLFDCLTVD